MPRLLSVLGPLVPLCGVALWSSAALADAPPSTHMLLEGGEGGSPLAYDAATLSVRVNASAASRYETFDTMEVDQEGNTYAPEAAINTQLRVGGMLEARWGGFGLSTVYEHDVYTGVASGGATELDGTGLPYEGQDATDELRKAYAQISTPVGFIRGGYMTSHWGLGMLSNDGAHGWKPGSAYFGDPRSGDRVLRAALATGLPKDILPLQIFFAYDQVQDDDILLDGDEANQFVTAIRYNSGGDKPLILGSYAAFREQTAPDEQVTDVVAVDVFAQWGKRFGSTELDLAFEGVYITGDTEWAPNTTRQKHDVQQAGALLRTGLTWGPFGLVTDLLYASGDQNFDDDQQNAIKMDPNLEMGLILFRQLNAATSARAVARASDPDLIGVPSEDLDRYPTRGSVSNATLFFPRLWYRMAPGLEVYGGPLVALSDVSTADPRNSRLNGGDPRNALGGEPGGYLGTEFDLGLRYQARLGFAELMLGMEGGYFAPGAAFERANGGTPDAIMGGRFIGRIRL